MPASTLLRRPQKPVAASQITADLLASAAVIRRTGLSRHQFRDHDTGALCAVGAVHEAVCPGFWTSPDAATYMTDERADRAGAAVEAVSDFLGALWPGSGQPRVICWADADGRTTEQVATLFEATAAVQS